jgi:hypothetical protein
MRPQVSKLLKKRGSLKMLDDISMKKGDHARDDFIIPSYKLLK